jgi:hypothetical protein
MVSFFPLHGASMRAFNLLRPATLQKTRGSSQRDDQKLVAK